MEKEYYSSYIQILREELVPAMGCTEPISLAYCASKAREVLCDEIVSGTLYVSPNIVKNVKSVVVPHTNGLVGLKAAFLIGIIAGDASNELNVLCQATREDEIKLREMMDSFPLEIEVCPERHIFDIAIALKGREHTSYVRIVDDHTNIVEMVRDDKKIIEKEIVEKTRTDRTVLNVRDILDFADNVPLEKVSSIITDQIRTNMAIAEEGLKNPYGANIGKMYLSNDPDCIETIIKAYAAAGSDARMNGCEMPVTINSGSGNQGLTCSVPVIVFGRKKSLPEEKIIRALLVSNLITIHLKSGIGTLSAYCGVVSAGAGAASGISYLRGKSYDDIAHVIINTLAIDSGIICDGAKASCAAKIAMAVESGLLGIRMQENDNNFCSGCGIIKCGVEETIQSVNRLARKGMAQTDKEIIRIMLE